MLTTITEYRLQCDHCLHCTEIKAFSQTSARLEARARGWRRGARLKRRLENVELYQGEIDVCPNCVDQLVNEPVRQENS